MTNSPKLSIAAMAVMSRRTVEHPPQSFTNIDPPGISGTPVITSELTVIPGTWDDPDSLIQGYSYRWYANVVGGVPAAIPGATGLTYTVGAEYADYEITVIETAFGGTRSETAQSSPIGPIVINFPAFAPPYFLAPNAVGTGDGSSFANAAKWNQINTFCQAIFNNGGGIINLASHLGTYTAANPSISFGGTATAPCIIRGVNASLVATTITIQGSRTRPWVFGTVNGVEVFKILRGADYLTFRNIKGKDVGNGLFRIGGPITQLIIEDCEGDNVRRFLENNNSGTETASSITGLTIRRCPCTGFSKSTIHLDYDTNAILIEGADANTPMVLDSQFQGPDSFAIGIHLAGTCHDATIRYVHAYNCSSEEASDAFWNGDGFTAEGGTYNIAYVNCHALGNADSGYDLKTPHTASGYLTLDNCTSYSNGWNYKLWVGGVMTNCHSRDPFRRGGTGGTYHFRCTLTNILSTISIVNSSFADTDVAGVALIIEEPTPPNSRSTVTLTNVSYSGGRTPTQNNATGGATIVGSFVAAPVNTVVPTYVASGSAPTQLLTAGNGTWTGGAVTFAHQHLRDALYIQGADESTFTRDAILDQGVFNTANVFGITANGFHEGAVETAAAVSNFAILLDGKQAAIADTSFTENSAENVVIGALTIGGSSITGWSFSLDDNAGNKAKIVGTNLCAGAVATAYSGFTEFDVTIRAVKVAETDLVETFTIFVAKIFGATYRFIKPVATGTGDGSSWANAAELEDIDTLIGELTGVTGHILILAGNTYTQTTQIPITSGGVVGNYIEIYGSDLGGNPVGSTPGQLTFSHAAALTPAAREASIAFASYDGDSYTTIITGNRGAWTPTAATDDLTEPYYTGDWIAKNGNSLNGNNLFQMGAGAQYLKWHHLAYKNFGRAVFKFDVSGPNHIDWTDSYIYNVQDWLHVGVNSASVAVVSDCNIKRIKGLGCSKGFVTWRGGCHDIVHEDLWFDSARQSRDNYARCFSIDQSNTVGIECHTMTFTRCIAANTYDGLGSGYWQGDGWISEGRVHDLDWIDCLSFGHSDGAWDCKSDNCTWTRCVAMSSKKLYKNWGPGGVTTDCIAHDTKNWGGSGGFWMFDNPGNATTGIIHNNMLVYDSGAVAGGPASNFHLTDNVVNRALFSGSTINTTNFNQFVNTIAIGEVIIGAGSTIDGVTTDDALTTPAFVTSATIASDVGNTPLVWPTTNITATSTLTDQIAIMTAMMDSATAVFAIPHEADWNLSTVVVEGAFSLLFGWRRLTGRMYYQIPFTIGAGVPTLMRAVNVACFGGCVRTGTPFEDLKFTQGTGLVMTSDATVVSGANSRVVRITGFSDNTTSATPAGFTNHVAFSTDKGGDGGIYVDSLASGAATVAASARITSTSNPWACVSLALKPV